MSEKLLAELLEESRRTNKFLALISEQMELAFLQQFVNAAEPDALRLSERDESRSKVFEMRSELGLED